MKLKVNYDLFDKIKQSKKGLSVVESFFGFNEYFYFNRISIPLKAYNFYWITKNLLFEKEKLIAFLAISLYSTEIAIYILFCKLSKQKYMDDAQWDLNELANDLYKLEVKTTGELLQDSKLLESHYKFKFIDGKPTLKQEKYITVPLTNDYEETLLQ